MKLKRGDVLVKLRGGATKRVRVIGIGAYTVTVEALSKDRREMVRTYTLPALMGAIPDGYRLEGS